MFDGMIAMNPYILGQSLTRIDVRQTCYFKSVGAPYFKLSRIKNLCQKQQRLINSRSICLILKTVKYAVKE